MFFTCCIAFVNSTSALAKTEQDVKAAYLYNFIKFIEWPATDNGQDIQILCVLGKDAINDKLKLLNQRTVRGKILHVVDISGFEQSDIESCDILFVGQSEEKFLDKIFSNASSSSTPTLTISSIDEFADQGGIIGFVKLGNVIRFEINLKQALDTKLSISSKLLELANKVVR